MNIANKQQKRKWDAKIEWVDNHKYLKLSESDKKKLLRFRSLHSYINKMNKSIDIRKGNDLVSISIFFGQL